MEETTAGNIIKGFDNYIKGSSTTGGGGGAGGGPGTSSRRRGGITDADRIFSNSSVSFSKVRIAFLFSATQRVPTSIDLNPVSLVTDAAAKSLQDSPASTSAQTTPSHAPTPTPLSARDATNSNSNNTSNHPTPNETGSGLVKAGVTKKKKSTAAAVDKGDEEGDGRAAKRGKITYARE